MKEEVWAPDMCALCGVELRWVGSGEDSVRWNGDFQDPPGHDSNEAGIGGAFGITSRVTSGLLVFYKAGTVIT